MGDFYNLRVELSCELHLDISEWSNPYSYMMYRKWYEEQEAQRAANP